MLQATRARDLIRAAKDEVSRYAEEQDGHAKDYEADLHDVEANSDRLADEAFYDVGLERRLDRALSEAEDDFYHYHDKVIAAEEASAVLAECLGIMEDILPDVTAALAARRFAAVGANLEDTWSVS